MKLDLAVATINVFIENASKLRLPAEFRQQTLLNVLVSTQKLLTVTTDSPVLTRTADSQLRHEAWHIYLPLPHHRPITSTTLVPSPRPANHQPSPSSDLSLCPRNRERIACPTRTHALPPIKLQASDSHSQNQHARSLPHECPFWRTKSGPLEDFPPICERDGGVRCLFARSIRARTAILLGSAMRLNWPRRIVC